MMPQLNASDPRQSSACEQCVDSCLCIDLRVASILGTIWAWIVYIINLSVNVRQLNLLDDKESVRPFDSHNDESERAITTFIFLRILISLLALVSSLSSLAGTLLDKMLLIVPFIIVLIVGTLAEGIMTIMCWMLYWDEFYEPVGQRWQSLSIPFYLMMFTINALLTIAIISLCGNMVEGHGMKPSPNYRMNNMMNTSVGYEDTGPPPAIVPLQEPPRELPKPNRMNPECTDIINETIGHSTSFFQNSSSRSNMAETRRTKDINPIILSPTAIQSINYNLTRH